MTDARTICDALGGDWYGDYGRAFCPAHPNTDTPALSVTNAPNGKLLVHCFTGCSWQDVFTGLRKRGLLAGHSDWKPDPRKTRIRKAEDEAKRSHYVELARQCWTQGEPISGTLGERYLRARGITCDLPSTLHFDKDCWHGPTASKVPAMVATVVIGGELRRR